MCGAVQHVVLGKGAASTVCKTCGAVLVVVGKEVRTGCGALQRGWWRRLEGGCEDGVWRGAARWWLRHYGQGGDGVRRVVVAAIQSYREGGRMPVRTGYGAVRVVWRL